MNALLLAGLATWYSALPTAVCASGELYDPDALVAAHRTIPLGTRVVVFAPETGRSVIVTINDRGPYCYSRSGGKFWLRDQSACPSIIDLTPAAATRLGMSFGHNNGTPYGELFVKVWPLPLRKERIPHGYN